MAMTELINGKLDKYIGVNCSTSEKEDWEAAFRHGELSRIVRNHLNKIAAKRLGKKSRPAYV